MKKKTLLGSLAIENFRIFRDETHFEFAPITFLVGPNNSGKSSLIKLLMLLKSGLSEGNGHFSNLKFKGENHNLKSFDNVLSANSIYSHISFSLEVDFWGYPMLVRYKFERNEDGTEGKWSKLELLGKNDENPFILCQSSSLRINLKVLQYLIEENLTLLQESERKKEQEKKEDNDKSPGAKKYLHFLKNVKLIDSSGLKIETIRLPFKQRVDEGKLIILPWESNVSNNLKDFQEIEFLKKLLVEVELLINSNQTSDLTNDSLLNIPIYDEDHHPTPILDIEVMEFPEEKYPVFYNALKGILNLIKNYNSQLVNLLRNNIDSLGILRASQQYFYKKDPSDKAQVFENLLQRFIDHHTDKNVVGSSITFEFLKEWTMKFKLGFQDIESRDLNFLYFNKDKENQSLPDLGFGSTQLLSILLFISVKAHEHLKFRKDLGSPFDFQTLTIEEPEANLHPKFQSLLAEMFIDAADRFNINFVIETHSDLLIKKMQVLTKRNIIQPEDTVIYYFSEEHQVSQINIDADGSLDNEFGAGFYAESDELLFDLLKRSKKN